MLQCIIGRGEDTMANLLEAISATPLFAETAAVVGFLALIALVRRTVIGGQNRRSS
jgi:hypothetical protein